MTENDNWESMINKLQYGAIIADLKMLRKRMEKLEKQVKKLKKKGK